MSFYNNQAKPAPQQQLQQKVFHCNGPTDSISSVNFSNQFLCAASWDKNAYIWEVNAQAGAAIAKASFNFNTPLLCLACDDQGQRAFVGGCDNTAKVWMYTTNQTAIIGSHAAPVKEIFYIPEFPSVCTGSWDKTIKFWDLRHQAGQATQTIPLNERVYCMDVKSNKLLVGMAEKKISVYDLRNLSKSLRDLDSPLKFQTRCVSLFTDCLGFAVGSIEGRVGIQHIDPVHQSKNFAFKAHRPKDTNDVYSVNTIAFNKQFNTCVTCGAEGTYAFWDKDNKYRLSEYKTTPQQSQITSCAFNNTSTLLALAQSYDWSKGAEGWDRSKPNTVAIHVINEKDIRPKS